LLLCFSINDGVGTYYRIHNIIFYNIWWMLKQKKKMEYSMHVAFEIDKIYLYLYTLIVVRLGASRILHFREKHISYLPQSACICFFGTLIIKNADGVMSSS